MKELSYLAVVLEIDGLARVGEFGKVWARTFIKVLRRLCI